MKDPATGALIVFLRWPEWGKVKTRVARTAGEDKALEIYKELVAITYRTVASVQFPVHLFYHHQLPPDSERDKLFSYHLQSPGDLGSKMSHAFSEILLEHPKAVIIGSDCPELTADFIMESFMRLDVSDVVLGPALDGGYYLLGCKKIMPSLFTDIHWSTEDVLPKTIERIEQAGLSYYLLPVLRDIDTEEDWIRYLKNDIV